MDKLLTAPEVQMRLRISETTLRRWASQGVIPSYRTPTGHLRFKAEDVDAALSPYPVKETVTT